MVPHQRLLGIACLVAAVTCWSTSGLFVRELDMGTWTILFWRGLAAVSMLALVALVAGWRSGRLSVRAPTLGTGLVGLSDAVVTITYIGALNTTSVADVAVIYASVPLVGGLLAWLVLGERCGPGVILASVVALCGVTITVANAGASVSSVAGDLLALLMTFAMAGMMVLARLRPDVDALQATAMSALLTAAIAVPFMEFGLPAPGELAILALFGAVQMILGLVLFIEGSKRVGPAENGLIGCLDTPLAPLWVWLVFQEVPLATTALGGALILLAVLAHLGLTTRQGVAAPGAGRVPGPDALASH